MKSLFSKLPHAGIQTLIPYQPGKSIASLEQELGIQHVIKLASNENALGCSPQVKAALAALPIDQIATYPSPLHHPLHPYLCHLHHIEPTQLLLANGSDALISLLLTTFALHTGRTVLIHDYAFNAFQIQAQTLGIPVQSAPIHPDWSVDMDALIALCQPTTALIFIANPNNPTGSYLPAASLKQLLAAIPPTTICVLDEAYIEFTTPTENSVDWLAQYPNLVLLRTFSKIHGLAGLRLGYAMGNADLIALLMRSQLPFTVNQAAMVAGLSALQDRDFVKKSVRMIQAGMVQLTEGFRALSLIPLPSQGNFIMVDCQQPAQPLYEQLLHQGIIVRPLLPYGLSQHLRITIGTPKQNERLLTCLHSLLTKSHNN